MPNPPKTALEYLDEVAKEYSQYVAVVPININGQRAFNVGDPVPNSHVDRGVVESDQVAKNTTKAGQAAVANTQES